MSRQYIEVSLFDEDDPYEIHEFGQAEPVAAFPRLAYYDAHPRSGHVIWEQAGCDVAAHHNKRAKELTPALEKALGALLVDTGRFRQFMPFQVGFDDVSVETVIDFLSKLLSACREHPDTLITVR